MQLGRLLRIVEEAYLQNSLIDLKQLSLVCNITPTSIRSRFRGVRELGISLPLLGLSAKDREQGGMLRSTYLLRSHFSDESMVHERQQLAVSRSAFRGILARFAALLHHLKIQDCEPKDPEEREWAELAAELPENQLQTLLHSFPPTGRDTDWSTIKQELEADFGLSPVRIRAVRELIDEIIFPLQAEGRGCGHVLYFAVAASEPAGKPLDACKLVPVELDLLDEDDWPSEDNKDLNQLSDIKYAKIVRYTTQAKRSGGYLTYADLSF